MPRSIVVAAVFLSSACAAILPDRLGPYYLQPLEMKGPEIDKQMAEYGADGWDGADYGSFSLTAWRFKDVTGAYAASLEAFSKGDPSSKSTLRVGNYLLSCQGKCPKNLAALADAALPNVSHGSLPTLGTYFPEKNLVPHSERYILGPVGLAANVPEIPIQAALFDFGTEAELARYRTPAGTVALAVFSFATPSLARQQLAQFQKVASIAVKRTGPLVAIVFGPAAAAEASSKLVSNINYLGVVAENEKPPDKPLELKPESAGKMVLAILSLAGLLLAFCLLSGLAVGGALRLARRFGYSAAEGSLITLHLEGK
jgi:hypothetical protein